MFVIIEECSRCCDRLGSVRLSWKLGFAFCKGCHLFVRGWAAPPAAECAASSTEESATDEKQALRRTQDEEQGEKDSEEKEAAVDALMDGVVVAGEVGQPEAAALQEHGGPAG